MFLHSSIPWNWLHLKILICIRKTLNFYGGKICCQIYICTSILMYIGEEKEKQRREKREKVFVHIAQTFNPFFIFIYTFLWQTHYIIPDLFRLITSCDVIEYYISELDLDWLEISRVPIGESHIKRFKYERHLPTLREICPWCTHFKLQRIQRNSPVECWHW